MLWPIPVPLRGNLDATMEQSTVNPARVFRVAYFVSHPIQYQTPLLRRLSLEPWIDLTVFFASDMGVTPYHDQGFGVEIKWDVPLLDGYKYEFLPSNNAVNLGLLSRLKGIDAMSRFDAVWVHGYSYAFTIQAMFMAKLLGIPVLLRAEPWLNDRERGRAKLLLKKASMKLLQQFVSAVLPIGTLNQLYWKYYFGENFPAFMMPYAVDNLYFQKRCQTASVSREAFRASLGILPGCPVILFASKLETRKHCDDLLRAYKLILPSVPDTSIPHLIIVGDGQERANLENLAADLNLDSVLFAGFQNQSELPRFLDLASVFVLPSRHEPWGLAVNEAMNAGTAIIVSEEVGCHVDLISDGIEGYKYPVRDIRALAAALSKVLESSEYTETIGRNALRRINKWSFEEDIKGLQRALISICSGTSRNL